MLEDSSILEAWQLMILYIVYTQNDFSSILKLKIN